MQTDKLPTVSVVIPNFNGELHIRETLDSVFSQSISNLEIIVVDDGSTDGSIQLLKSYGDRIHLIQQQNNGPAAARNRGVEAARSNWIAFLDADDIWIPNKLEQQLILAKNYRWSHTDSEFVGGANNGRRDSEFTKKYSGNILEDLVSGNFIGTSTVLLQREIFLEAGGFDTSLRSIQDWDLWVRLAKLYPIGYIDQPLLKYRVHSTSTSRNTRKTLPNHLAVIEKIFSPTGPAVNLRHLHKPAKAKSYEICSLIAEEEKDYGFSIKCTTNAWLCRPSNLSLLKRILKVSIKYLLHKLRII
jgi:glycosyltransferase involved in cell wall biosynthesis